MNKFKKVFDEIWSRPAGKKVRFTREVTSGPKWDVKEGDMGIVLLKYYPDRVNDDPLYLVETYKDNTFNFKYDGADDGYWGDEVKEVLHILKARNIPENKIFVALEEEIEFID